MLSFLNIGPTEWVIVLVIALLLFGRRLPEVMRNLGKGIVEFKRGVRGIEDQIEEESTRPAPPPPQQHQAVGSGSEGDPPATPSATPSSSEGSVS